jgi:DNA-binding SARP family transcriptional activator/tetratricopeptide (TPR) repeat protein
MAAQLAGTPLALPTSERARALVAWLALHPGHHPRAVVAEQLWPDAGAESARANLRTALWAVRTAWGEEDSPLRATRTTLALVDVSVDVDDEPIADRGFAELLPGLDDDWVLRARAELADRRAQVLAGLAEAAETDGDAAGAVRWSRRLAELRPLDESAHRSLVERLLRAGERATAVVAAREFAERLREEVGVRPSPATRAVHARVSVAPGGDQRATVFGRSAQVGALQRVWREAADGRGQVVVISGEAGIGKTTLLTELARRVTDLGGHAATTAGIDVAGETPFAAWLDLARTLAGGVRQVPVAASWPAELNRLSPGLGARLGHPQQPPPATAPELERLRVFEALLRLVEWSCAERPTLLAIDDAHRADRASLRLAAYVGRRLPSLPALLVLVRREGVRRPDLDGLLADLGGQGVPVTTIDVPPITDSEVGALARSLHELDGDRIDTIVAAAEGNPLLAVEAARAVVAGMDGPPPNLRAAVTATVSRLPEPTAALVGLLAAAGRPLWPDELRRLEVPGGVDLVAGSEGLLVRREGRIGFRHELLRAAVYAGLADPAGLHDRLADGIDPDEHVERAHHLEEAGRSREAARELAAAALRARTVGALDEAADLLGRAVVLDPADGMLWLELEETCAFALRHQEMETAWREALDRLPVDALPEAWCRRGRQFRSVTCHPEQALLAYRTARGLATSETPPSVRADALVGMAWGDAVVGSGNEFERLLAEAFRLVEPGPLLSADALDIQMQGLIRQGRFTEAAALVSDPRNPVVRLVDQIPDRRYSVFVSAAAGLLCVGDDLGALALVDRALASTVTGMELKTLAARAQILARLGRHQEAEDAAAQVQAWADRLDDPALAATSTHDRGLIAWRAGNYAEAAELIGRGLDGGARVSRVAAGLTRAEALALAGDPDAAAAQLRSALLEPVARSDQAWASVPRVAWVQALIAHARGDVALTRKRLDEAAAAWHRLTVTARDEAGEEYLASLVDLGRPPVVGLVEPARELERIAALAASLEPVPDPAPVR